MYDEIVENFIKSLIKFKRIEKPAHREEELSFSEMRVLVLVKENYEERGENSGLKMSAMSKILSISKPALTQIINKLESAGFVERRFLKEDRRVTYIFFTEKGHYLFEREAEKFKLRIKNIFEKMGAQDSEEFVRLFEKFCEIMRGELL